MVISICISASVILGDVPVSFTYSNKALYKCLTYFSIVSSVWWSGGSLNANVFDRPSSLTPSFVYSLTTQKKKVKYWWDRFSIGYNLRNILMMRTSHPQSWRLCFPNISYFRQRSLPRVGRLSIGGLIAALLLMSGRDEFCSGFADSASGARCVSMRAGVVGVAGGVRTGPASRWWGPWSALPQTGIPRTAVAAARRRRAIHHDEIAIAAAAAAAAAVLSNADRRHRPLPPVRRRTTPSAPLCSLIR